MSEEYEMEYTREDELLERIAKQEELLNSTIDENKEIYKKMADLDTALEDCTESLTDARIKIKELEEENARLKDKLNNLSKVAEVRLANWQKYEKENAEQKKKIENLQKYLDTQNCYRECAETWVKLTNAKELLKKLYDETRGYINDQGFDIKILTDVEQFLNSLLSNF